jgi:RNA polymerase sigma-70 factor, ECF subfamily
MTLPAVEDPALVPSLRAGDVAAFDAVYAAFRPRLYGYLLRCCQDEERARDLLQETWLRAARAAPRLRDDTRLGPWLFTIARRVHLSDRRWRRADLTRILLLGTRPRAAPRDPLDELLASESQRRLDAGLARLSLAHREVLLLVGGEGFTPAEVAAVLGIHAATARQRLTRARAALAAALEEDAHAP